LGAAFFRQIAARTLTIFGTSDARARAQFLRKSLIYRPFRRLAGKSGPWHAAC